MSLICFAANENIIDETIGSFFLHSKTFYLAILFFDLEIMLNLLHFVLEKKNFSRKKYSTTILSYFFYSSSILSLKSFMLYVRDILRALVLF